MTFMYGVQWPYEASPEQALIPKWTHAALAEHDFVSEWEAIAQACELAFELGMSFAPTVNLDCEQRPKRGRLRVSFASTVQVFFGCDDLIQAHAIEVLHEVLASSKKPWSLRPQFPDGSSSSKSHVHAEPRYHVAHAEVMPACIHDDPAFVCDLPRCRVRHFLPIPAATHPSWYDSFHVTDSLIQAVEADPMSLSATVISNLFGQFFNKENQDHPKSIVHADMHTGFEALRGGDVCIDHPDDRTSQYVVAKTGTWSRSVQCSDPLSCEAVLISPEPCQSCHAPSPICHTYAPSKKQQAGSHEERDPASSCSLQSAVTSVPSWPEFLCNMLGALPDALLFDPCFKKGFIVKTWYLHHRDLRRTRVFRQVHLSGSPATWRSKIVTAWQDRIVHSEDLQIDLVRPTPPRGKHERYLVFDLIVSQDRFQNRVSGLVSVLTSPGDGRYSPLVAAISFPEQVTGRRIVTYSDSVRLCQTFACIVSHGDAMLSLLETPVHQMRGGDSFVIHATSPMLTSFEVSNPTSGNAQSSHSSGQSTAQIAGSSNQGSGRQERTDLPSSAYDVPGTLVPRHRVNLYRLGHPPITALVSWSSFHELLADIVSALQVSWTDVVMPHFVHAKPVGESPLERSIIVQMRDDITPASNDQLVLQDLVIHHHGNGDNSLASQSTDRRVVRIQKPVTRTHVLQYAHVNQYCQFVRDRCLVHVNHLPWQLQDLAPRDLLHGTYIQVVLPPPDSRMHDVLKVVQVTEDFGALTEGSFQAQYPSLALKSPRDSSGSGHLQSGHMSLDEQSKGTNHAAVFRDDGYWPILPVGHLNDDDQNSPPRFEREVAIQDFVNQQPLPVLPELHNFERFRLQMRTLFEEFAVTDFVDQGPVLHVVTWYIHHDHHTSCFMSRTVQLEANPLQWARDLCAPWLHLIQAFQPLAFRDVTPMPLRAFHEPRATHIILEQGLHRPQYTALISTLIQGQHHDGTFHRAVSIERAISAEDIVRYVGLESRCAVYRCTAWSGRMQFTPSLREEVFSGIGILLHVHEARFRHQLNDNGSDHPFWHPVREAPSSSNDPRILIPISDASAMSNAPDTRVGVDQGLLPHDDRLFRPDLLTAWHTHLAGTTHRPIQFLVVTWFCDHVRLPRSVENRLVTLPIDAELWKPALIQAWQDWVLPGLSVEFYVVNPEPYGDAVPVVAHVILAQNQLPEYISALISTTAEGEDPWMPAKRVVKLPRVVDHWVLVHEGGLMHLCPPFSDQFDCKSWFGVTELTDGHLRPSFSGDGFLVVAASRIQAAIQYVDSDLEHIDRLFAQLSDCISTLVTQVCDTLQQFCLPNHSQCDHGDHRQVMLHTIRPLKEQVPPTRIERYEGSLSSSFSIFPVIDPVFIEPILRLAHHHPNFDKNNVDRSLQVMVWFVDHVHQHACSAGRIVQLQLPNHQWISQIAAAWSDIIDASVPIVMHVTHVHSGWATQRSDIHAHVIVSQNVVPSLVSVLVELDFSSSDHDSCTQLAVVVPQFTSKASLHAVLRPFLSQDAEFHGQPSVFQDSAQIVCLDEVASLTSGLCVSVRVCSKGSSIHDLDDADFTSVLQTCVAQTSSRQGGKVEVPVPKRFPVPLCLEAVIPVAAVNKNDLDPNSSELVWFQQEDWYQFCHSFPTVDLFPLPDGLIVPAVSYDALLTQSLHTPSDQWQWEVYVDGSAGTQQAGWSVVIVVHDGVDACFCGCFAGHVQLDPAHENWYGADELDNIAAELTAFLMAQDVIWRRLPTRRTTRSSFEQACCHI